MCVYVYTIYCYPCRCTSLVSKYTNVLICKHCERHMLFPLRIKLLLIKLASNIKISLQSLTCSSTRLANTLPLSSECRKITAYLHQTERQREGQRQTQTQRRRERQRQTQRQRHTDRHTCCHWWRLLPCLQAPDRHTDRLVVIAGFLQVSQNKIPRLSLTFPVNHTTFPWPISTRISVLKLHHKNTITCNTSTNYALKQILMHI